MPEIRGNFRKRQDLYRILAMILVGVGLLVIGIGAFVILPQSGGLADREASPSAIPVEVDYPAPQLSLKDLQGNPVSLQDYRGQVILVNNWATWCPPCTAEMPALQTYYEEHQERDFTIVAIEAGEPVSEVADFVTQYGLTFQVWSDPDQKALVTFRNLGLPSSYLIDRDGTIRLTWTGAISFEMLEKYVTPFLEG